MNPSKSKNERPPDLDIVVPLPLDACRDSLKQVEDGFLWSWRIQVQCFPPEGDRIPFRIWRTARRSPTLEIIGYLRAINETETEVIGFLDFTGQGWFDFSFSLMALGLLMVLSIIGFLMMPNVVNLVLAVIFLGFMYLKWYQIASSRRDFLDHVRSTIQNM